MDAAMNPREERHRDEYTSSGSPPSSFETSENTTTLTDDMIKLIMSTELREKANLFQSSNKQSNLLKKFLETQL